MKEVEVAEKLFATCPACTFTGDRYEIRDGGEEKTLLRTLDSIPVLAKAGAILPLSADQGNMCDNPTNLEVWAYEGDGEYSLYEDKGDKSCVTVFKLRIRQGSRFWKSIRKAIYAYCPQIVLLPCCSVISQRAM